MKNHFSSLDRVDYQDFTLYSELLLLLINIIDESPKNHHLLLKKWKAKQHINYFSNQNPSLSAVQAAAPPNRFEALTLLSTELLPFLHWR